MRKDHSAKNIGTVSIEIPERQVVVGRRYCMEVTYKAGPKEVKIGGALRFRLPGLLIKEGETAPVSCSNPNVKLICSHVLPAVNGKNGSEFFTIDYLFVVIQDCSLQEGDSVTVRYGENIALPGMAAPPMAQNWQVEVAVDLDGLRDAPGSGFYLVEDSPILQFVNDKACRMEVTIPSTTPVNEPFETFIKLRDRYQNLVEDYTGTVKLLWDSKNGPIPIGACRFSPEDRGVHIFKETSFPEEGINRIKAVDESYGLFSMSNPSKTTKDDSAFRLFWGDTHCHSKISADEAAYNSLTAGPEECYIYARRKAGLQFCMVTDHIEDQSEAEWEETRRAAEMAYKPGKFVTFSGFEATYKPSRHNGDKNVYFLNDDEPWVNHGTTEELYDNLKRRQSKVMVIPHLHAPTNWDLHDSRLEKVVEVYAHWGCGLSPGSDPPIIPGCARPAELSVEHALKRGARLGFIASADHSFGHPGDDFWWVLSNYTGGLAAVYATSLTREGVWEGLWNRRCYGTTRARILLEFEINGHVMGEEFAIGQSDRELKVSVSGTCAIDHLNVVKNGRILTKHPGREQMDLTFSYIDKAGDYPTDYYYIHVVQVDGEQAWSSPIWVTVDALKEPKPTMF